MTDVNKDPPHPAPSTVRPEVPGQGQLLFRYSNQEKIQTTQVLTALNGNFSLVYLIQLA